MLKQGRRCSAIGVGGRQRGGPLDHIGDERRSLRDGGRVTEPGGEHVELLLGAGDARAGELLPHSLRQLGQGQQGQVIASEPLEQRRIKARRAVPETRRVEDDSELCGCRGRQRSDRRTGRARQPIHNSGWQPARRAQLVDADGAVARRQLGAVLAHDDR